MIILYFFLLLFLHFWFVCLEKNFRHNNVDELSVRFASCFAICIERHGGQRGQETNIRIAADSNG